MNLTRLKKDWQTFDRGSREMTSRVRSMMSAARKAQAQWATTFISERLKRVRELRRLIAAHGSVLAEASAFARRRPVSEALSAEVLPLAESCRFLEREAEALLASRPLSSRGLPVWLFGNRTSIHREPLGVILIIGPGNYPLLLTGIQLIQALVAGNAVVVKPGVGGSRSVRALIEIVRRVGIDSRLVGLLPESSEAARAAIEARPDKVLFTGSAATGESILTQLAPHLIPSTMELSGCDALVVRADADLDLVVRALRFGLTLNNGATCMAPKRVFVHSSVSTELEGRLSKVFRNGFGTVSGSEWASGSPESLPDDHLQRSATGAVETATSSKQETLRALIQNAIDHGAHFICGGPLDGRSIRMPVVLGGVQPSSNILTTDVFAPVLSLVTVHDDIEAILRANDCPYALGASIFTRDETAARCIAARLTAGFVSINDLIIPSADARVPFGGRKRSGFGVTRGAEGLLDLTAPKVVAVNRNKARPAFEKPALNDERVFQAYLELAHGQGFGVRLKALWTLFKRLRNRNRNLRNRIQ